MAGFSREIHVVVATTAFGTGINFPAIRYIIHYTLPSSLTEYMQNIGRGGRDGLPYKCILYFSYKNIHEQGAIWMYGALANEIPQKWKKFVEMIQFVFSLKCRRAFILPFFDATYDTDNTCGHCDVCLLRDEAEPRIDIQHVARIILKVLAEFQRSHEEGVVFTRLKDVITCHGLASTMQTVDERHSLRGIGAKSGFPSRNKAIWSIAVNYLMYSEQPFISENVFGYGAGGSESHPILMRKLVVTDAGVAWLHTTSQDTMSPLWIRHPVELLHCLHSDVQAMFHPIRPMSAQRSTTPKICSVSECANVTKAHGLCQMHYMRARRKATPTKKVPTTGSSPSESQSRFTSRQLTPVSSNSASSRSSSPVQNRHSPVQISSAIEERMPKPIARHAGEGFRLFSPIHNPVESSSSDEFNESSLFESMLPEDSSVRFTHDQVHDGQFYPGITLTDDCVFDCYGRQQESLPFVNQDWQRYEFAKGNPFIKFNSFAKQQQASSDTSNTRKYKCLGCFVCPDPQCRYSAAPGIRFMRTAASSRAAMFCPLHGVGNTNFELTHQPCTVEFAYVTDVNDSVVLTVTGGPHRHRLPPPTQLAPSTMKYIRDRITDASNGGRTTAMHVQQKSQGDEGSRDQRRVAHAISKTIADVFGKDLGIAGLQKVEEFVKKPWVRWAQPLGTQMGDFQMVLCQLEEQKILTAEVSKAHSGLTAKTTAFFFEDVTYAFADHYALTIMTESLVTGRGAVVAFILITRLHTGAYAMAFFQFMELNPSTWRIDTETQTILLQFVMVVDHADSQRKGFIEAVRMLHERLNLQSAWTQDLANSYLKHLQGCQVHYLSSVKNTAHNGNIVPAIRAEEFNQYCRDMLTAPSMEVFNSIVQQLRSHFPKCVTWLKRWVNPLHAVLIFPAFRASLLHQDLQEFSRNPKTTNLCESQHRNYYRYLTTLNLPLVLACINGFHYCVQQVADAEAVSKGTRPLTSRDRNAIVRKTATFARNMEFEGGVRPPVKTSEHLLKKSKTTSSQSSAAMVSSDVVRLEAPISPDHIKMRQRIVDGVVWSFSTSHHRNAHTFPRGRPAARSSGSSAQRHQSRPMVRENNGWQGSR